jgi:hypothetical protein
MTSNAHSGVFHTLLVKSMNYTVVDLTACLAAGGSMAGLSQTEEGS